MKYSQTFKLVEGMSYDFPDFDLTYLGKRKHDPKDQPEGVHIDDTYELFNIYCRNTDTSFFKKWSGGAGTQLPVRFACGTKIFTFEPWQERIKIVEEKDNGSDQPER